MWFFIHGVRGFREWVDVFGVLLPVFSGQRDILGHWASNSVQVGALNQQQCAVQRNEIRMKFAQQKRRHSKTA